MDATLRRCRDAASVFGRPKPVARLQRCDGTGDRTYTNPAIMPSSPGALRLPEPGCRPRAGARGPDRAPSMRATRSAAAEPGSKPAVSVVTLELPALLTGRHGR